MIRSTHFNFDDQKVVDDQVNSVPSIDLHAVVNNRERELPLN